MVHLAPLPPWRRRVQRIVGILLAVLGVVVLVIAIVALRQPNGHQAALRTSGVAESSTVSSPAASSTPPASSASAPLTSSVAPSTSATVPPSSTSAGTSGPKSVPLVVLNNTNQSDLAATAAAQFRAGGWTVTSTGNLVNNIASTCAYYDPNAAGAQAAATALKTQFPAIKRVVAKFDGLPAGPIIVVLTTGYS